MKNKLLDTIKLSSLAIGGIFIWALSACLWVIVLGLFLWASLWLYDKTVDEFSLFILLLDILALGALLKIIRSQALRARLKEFWIQIEKNM